ncbi:MAG: heme/hemin ABC transporter substrate-binding protein [Flavobacteriales bacterium]
MYRLIILFLFTIVFFSCEDGAPQAEQKTAQPRVVSLSGSITETLFMLGWGDKLVGVDVTSTYPRVVTKLPTLGHARSIQTEAVLALNPTHIFLVKDEVNPELISKWKSAGVSVIEISKEYSIEGSKNSISEIARALNQEEESKELIADIELQYRTLKDTMTDVRVLFIYARGGGNLMVSGTNTPVANMIHLAGAQNAITEFEDYKPLSIEYLIKSKPQVILMFDTGFDAIGGLDGLEKIPGVAETDAYKNKRIVRMDGQLLSGFGPRVVDGISELRTRLFLKN